MGDIRGRQRANRCPGLGQCDEHVISRRDASGVRGGAHWGLSAPPPPGLSVAPTGQSAPKPSQSRLARPAAPAFWRQAPTRRQSCRRVRMIAMTGALRDPRRRGIRVERDRRTRCVRRVPGSARWDFLDVFNAAAARPLSREALGHAGRDRPAGEC